MSAASSAFLVPFSKYSTSTPVFYLSNSHVRSFTAPTNKSHPRSSGFYGGASFFHGFCGFKLWILESLNLRQPKGKFGPKHELKIIKNQDKDHSSIHIETTSSFEEQASDGTTIELGHVSTSMQSPTSLPQTHSSDFPSDVAGRPSGPSLCIAVIGATGELARRKIFPALFALYYTGFLPENIGIFGYSRKNLTDEDLRSIIASTLTCRVDHQYDSFITFDC